MLNVHIPSVTPLETATPRPRKGARWSFVAGLFLMVSLWVCPAGITAIFAQSSDQLTLPDLGIPEVNTASLQPNVNAQGAGVSYRDNINGKLISVSP
jgi:hypothetical protein